MHCITTSCLRPDETSTVRRLYSASRTQQQFRVTSRIQTPSTVNGRLHCPLQCRIASILVFDLYINYRTTRKKGRPAGNNPPTRKRSEKKLVDRLFNSFRGTHYSYLFTHFHIVLLLVLQLNCCSCSRLFQHEHLSCVSNKFTYLFSYLSTAIIDLL